MTNQRAISHLKDISMWGIVKADEYNALKMAIEALEQVGNSDKLGTAKKTLVVEIGTCQNCVYWKKAHKVWGGVMYCEIFSDGESIVETEPDFYCANYK